MKAIFKKDPHSTHSVTFSHTRSDNHSTLGMNVATGLSNKSDKEAHLSWLV